MSNAPIMTEQISEEQIKESIAVQLAMLEQTAKRYLQRFYSAKLLDQGILFMPGVVKYAYKEIGITITEYAVMELLLIHWYQSDGLPEVGLNVLARELGKSKVQIWRHLKKLQQKGLLSIIHIFDQDGGQRNNRYDITPFVQKLEVFVHQNMGDIAENFVPETSDSVAVDALHVVATVQNTPSIDPVVAVEVETALVGSAGSVGVFPL
jgi:DNA-binding MarR family transcriptional regulator